MKPPKRSPKSQDSRATSVVNVVILVVWPAGEGMHFPLPWPTPSLPSDFLSVCLFHLTFPELYFYSDFII